MLYSCTHMTACSGHQRVLKERIGLHGKPTSELQDATWRMVCYHLQPLTQARPALTPARQATCSTQFTYPGGIEGWVDLGGWLHTEMVYPARRRSPVQVLTGPDSKIETHALLLSQAVEWTR